MMANKIQSSLLKEYFFSLFHQDYFYPHEQGALHKLERPSNRKCGAGDRRGSVKSRCESRQLLSAARQQDAVKTVGAIKVGMWQLTKQDGLWLPWLHNV